MRGICVSSLPDQLNFRISPHFLASLAILAVFTSRGRPVTTAVCQHRAPAHLTALLFARHRARGGKILTFFTVLFGKVPQSPL
jgi:hypothetical protein